MKTASEIWNEALDLLKSEVTETGFNTVFKNVEATEIKDDVFYLSTSNMIYKDLFEVYETNVKKALMEITGKVMDIKLVINDNIPEFKPEGAEDEIEESIEKGFTGINSRFTFDNFIVGKNSEFAYAATLAIATRPFSHVRNPLFLYGNSGLGKTHLMHAVANETLKRNPDKKVLCLTAEQFCNMFIKSIRYENQVQFRKKFRNVDMLLIDDVQFFAGKDGIQEEFFYTFEELVGANKQIMLTSDRPAKDIMPLADRLRTRFSGGLTTDIQPPDFETRVAILHSKIKNAGGDVEVSDEILNLIAQTIKSNIRELEGSIRTILAWKEIQKKEIDTETAIKILEDYFVLSPMRKIDAELIIKEVQKHFGLGENTIVSQKKDKSIAYPRQIAMTICHELTGLSYTEIGKEFDKSHATVIHNINKIRDEMEKNLDTYNMVQDLINNIKNYNE